MSLIAIGDVHGCPRTLRRMIDVLRPGCDDRLVFIGDYVDRGPDSKGVVDFCLELSRRHACTFLRGNHEAYVLRFLSGLEDPRWKENGGAAALRSYADDSGRVAIPDAHRKFFRSTKLFHETPRWVFVHAGLRPDLSVRANLARGDESVFLEERSHLYVEDGALPWEKTVVCGHTPMPRAINRSKLICIDTGCAWVHREGQGRLTAVRLPEREFVAVLNADL